MRRKLFAAATALCLAAGSLPMAAFAEEETSEAFTEALEEESETEEAYEPFDYSAPFDEKGFFAGVKALDYVTLPAYEGIKLDAADVLPTEDEIMEQIQSVLNTYSTVNEITDSSRKVQDGDTLSIDFAGAVDGEYFEGGTAEDYEVTIGVTSFIDGFLDQLIGHAPGETFDINVTFPDPYLNNTDLSGKDAVFTITINYIAEEVFPELTDEFVVENLGDYESAEHFRAETLQTLYNDNLYNALINYLLENSEVSEVPEEIVEAIYEERYEYINEMVMFYGMTPEDYLSYYGMTLDDLRSMAEGYGSNYLVIQAIMEDAGLTMTSDIAKEQLGVDDEVYDSYVEYYGEPYILFSESTDYVLRTLSESTVLVDEDGNETPAVTAEAEEEAESESAAE